MTEILAKYLSGNASDDEKNQIKNWRNQNSENSEEFLQFSKAWNHNSHNNFNSKVTFSSILSEIEPDNQVFIKSENTFSTYLKYAAILILGIGVSFLVYNSEIFNSELVYQTNLKQTQEIILPDGSKVHLSENSSISLVGDFEGTTRKVELKGKAFFDITRDEQKPFIVRTYNSNIKVLGTSFLVDSYNDNNTKVVVKTGKVSVAKNSGSSTTLELIPGEVATVNKQVEKSINTNQNYLSWKTKIIDFNKSPMSDVINTLEEVYFVKIKVSDTDINNCTLSAKFDHRDIDVVMEIISQTFNLDLKQKGKNRYQLNGSGCSSK